MSTTYRQVLSLNPGNFVAGDVNELHKLVMAGYRDRLDGVSTIRGEDGNQLGPRAQANILFAAKRRTANGRRTWPLTAGSAYRLLVQADTPGDWSDTTYIQDKALALSIGDPFTVDTTVGEGTLVEITTEVHATRRHAPKSGAGEKKTRGSRGVRYTLTHPHEVATWTEDTFARLSGVTLHRDGMQVSAPQRLTGRMVGEEQSGLVFDTCHVTATGTVHDPDAFAAALQTGLGRSRAYGAGLIRYRPLTIN